LRWRLSNRHPWWWRAHRSTAFGRWRYRSVSRRRGNGAIGTFRHRVLVRHASHHIRYGQHDVIYVFRQGLKVLKRRASLCRQIDDTVTVSITEPIQD